MLVGLNKKQLRELPKSIIGLERTESLQELAGIYTTADVFFNPTREDNYPTTNLEAEACGTKVITYDIGGCRETITPTFSEAVSGYDDALCLLEIVATTSEPERDGGEFGMTN